MTAASLKRASAERVRVLATRSGAFAVVTDAFTHRNVWPTSAVWMSDPKRHVPKSFPLVAAGSE